MEITTNNLLFDDQHPDCLLEVSSSQGNTKVTPSEPVIIETATADVASRLVERFEETRTSVDKDVEPTQKVAVSSVKTPTVDDIAAFLALESISKESINNFGYLLLSGNSQHEAEALNNIKAAFQQFIQQAAA